MFTDVHKRKGKAMSTKINTMTEIHNLLDQLEADNVTVIDELRDAIYDLEERAEEAEAAERQLKRQVREWADDLQEAAPLPDMSTPLSPEALLYQAIDRVSDFGLSWVSNERGDTEHERFYNYVMDAKESADMEQEVGPDLDMVDGIIKEMRAEGKESPAA